MITLGDTRDIPNFLRIPGGFNVLINGKDYLTCQTPRLSKHEDFNTVTRHGINVVGPHGTVQFIPWIDIETLRIY